MRVLVTGAFGWTAISIIQTIKQAGHEVLGLDLPTAICPDQTRPLLSTVIVGDIANFDSINLAVESVDAVVHLAIAIKDAAYQNPDIPFSVNVKGTYNLCEAARRHGIERIVLMSSAAVHLKHRKGQKMQATTDWKSSYDQDHLYDLTKRLQEEIAKDFCETHGMNIIVLRAGHIVDGRLEVDPNGRHLSTIDYCRGGWVCRYDLANACLKSLELSPSGYHAFHVIGDEKARAYFDIAKTERELGFTFETRFERY